MMLPYLIDSPTHVEILPHASYLLACTTNFEEGEAARCRCGSGKAGVPNSGHEAYVLHCFVGILLRLQ